MYQVKFSGSQAFLPPSEQKPTPQTVFYNPLGHSPAFPSYNPRNPNSQSVLHVGKNPSEKTNVSGNASTEYSTPRMLLSTGIHGNFNLLFQLFDFIRSRGPVQKFSIKAQSPCEIDPPLRHWNQKPHQSRPKLLFFEQRVFP